MREHGLWRAYLLLRFEQRLIRFLLRFRCVSSFSSSSSVMYPSFSSGGWWRCAFSSSSEEQTRLLSKSTFSRYETRPSVIRNSSSANFRWNPVMPSFSQRGAFRDGETQNRPAMHTVIPSMRSWVCIGVAGTCTQSVSHQPGQCALNLMMSLSNFSPVNGLMSFPSLSHSSMAWRSKVCPEEMMTGSVMSSCQPDTVTMCHGPCHGAVCRTRRNEYGTTWWQISSEPNLSNRA